MTRTCDHCGRLVEHGGYLCAGCLAHRSRLEHSIQSARDRSEEPARVDLEGLAGFERRCLVIATERLHAAARAYDRQHAFGTVDPDVDRAYADAWRSYRAQREAAEAAEAAVPPRSVAA